MLRSHQKCAATELTLTILRCPVPGCGVQTFREQVPGVLERYQRRTTRLSGQVSAAARELAGRASARLLPALGIAVSRHTAVRVLLAIPLPGPAVPRVPGIDLSRSRDYPDRVPCHNSFIAAGLEFRGH